MTKKTNIKGKKTTEGNITLVIAGKEIIKARWAVGISTGFIMLLIAAAVEIGRLFN